MFIDKKSQSPDNAPSGVRQDMFVAFITCERYSRRTPEESQVSADRHWWIVVCVLTSPASSGACGPSPNGKTGLMYRDEDLAGLSGSGGFADIFEFLVARSVAITNIREEKITSSAAFFEN